MAAGIIPYNQIPSPVPAGLFEACEVALALAGFSTQATRAPDGVHVSDVPTVTATIASYVGSAAQLAYAKAQLQAALDAEFDANFDLSKFIRGGTVTGITAAQIGTFLATITNNYRTLRASIASAANVAAVNAINIASGWPSNP
jgi:hypothetical protein